MPIMLPAKVYSNLGSGEMTDKSTGEVITWGKRSEVHVHFPGEEFPSLLKVKGHYEVGTVGAVEVTFRTKMDRAAIVMGEFIPHADGVDLNPTMLARLSASIKASAARSSGSTTTQG